MSDDLKPTRQFLEEREAVALAELRRLAPQALDTYLEARAALLGIMTHDELERQRNEYFGIRKAIDAVEKYLGQTKRLEDKYIIAQRIADGGFARGEETRPYWNILDAIRYHTNVSGRLTAEGDMIGLPSWRASQPEVRIRDGDKVPPFSETENDSKDDDV